ncbi:MAG TPA: hypothetical protein VGJ05_17160 [Fimbriiglobus sp.]|jgi:hypothetical protein
MFAPYAPRRITSLGIRTIRGFRLKAYSIVFSDDPFDFERFGSGLELAAAELPSPAVDAGRPGVGFVVLHQGRTADYLVLGWWDRENELPLRVFVRDGTAWRPAIGGESVCVWDLQVIWHERETYVATLLGGSISEAVDAYLNDTISARA